MRFLSIVRIDENSGLRPSPKLMADMGKLMEELTREGKLINIHPSLLPAYKGTRVHERVIEAKEAVSGASVHFVVPELDAGPVIAQAKVPVHPSDTPQTLADRVLAVEHKLYPEALKLLASEKVKLENGLAVFS